MSVSSESRPCGRRYLAVWPLGSGRVASGLSPRGVASFYTLGRGLRMTRVEWSSIYPVPAPLPVLDPQQCPTCPHPAGLRLPSWRASWCSLSAGGVELRVTAASGANATCGSGFSGAGSGGFTTGPVAVPVVTPRPVPHVLERGQTRSALSNNDKEGRPHQGWMSGERGQFEDR